ncbi:hypothetical protein BH11ARM2_BH11ARM2_27360 [soil metagenome]
MLRMWVYDVAREQHASREILRELGELSVEAGYDAIGLYLEHRFAYPSTPWSHGKGVLTPDDVRWFQDRFRGKLKVVPFVNLLGHFEGMLYTEEGKKYAEERFKGMQADPTNSAFLELAGKIIDDTLEIFESGLIHIGGDETAQLGRGERSRERVATFEAKGTPDGKVRLYAEHFAPLAQRVIDAGRRPAVWGDMFFEHPAALDAMSKETLIFDWQYFRRPDQTARFFLDKGFETVLSPTVHTYNALWCHLAQTERNVREHVEAAHALGAAGVCVTTWEQGLFGNYETLLPVVRGCGRLLSEEPVDRGSEASTHIDVKLRDIHIDSHRSIEDEGSGEYAGNVEMAPIVRLASAMVATMLSESASSFFFEPEGEGQRGFAFRPDAGNEPLLVMPENIVEATLGRLRLLAGMSPVGRGVASKGEIRGIADGNPFQIHVRYEPLEKFARMTFQIEGDQAEPSHTSTVAPETLQGQGGAVAVAAYAEETEAPVLLREYLKLGEQHETWARLMGIDLPAAGGPFAFSGIRSSIKCRLLLYSNPFLLWLRDRDSLLGEEGIKATEILNEALAFAPDAAYRGVTEFGLMAMQFVRSTEEAAKAYAERKPGEALTKLSVCRQVFQNLEKIAKSTHFRFGGSLADVERCRTAQEHVERVIRRIKQYGAGELGYLPSFETICHPKFVPHDQGNWWLINDWANE